MQGTLNFQPFGIKIKFQITKTFLFEFCLIMQIRPITLQYSTKYQNPSAKPDLSFGLNCKRLQDLTFEKYKNLSFLEKLKYRFITPLRIKHDALVNYYAARRTKISLDEYFGRDNYTAMIIGRSMATIGETMRYLGSDVRILPMSGLSDGLPKEIKHVDVYKSFLDSIGLTKEFIEQNPKRNFILIDFVSSGSSLKNAHKFLSRPELLGNSERLQLISSQELLGTRDIMASYLETLFMLQNLKKYSPVSRLNLTELDKTFESLQPMPEFKQKRELFLYNIMRKVDNYKKKTGR